MALKPLMPLAGSGHTPPDPEKIRQAARGFEGMFLTQLLKVMRNSVSKPESQTLLHSDGMGDFADMELARVLAEKRGIGLSDMIYRSLSAKMENEAKPSGEGISLKAAVKPAVPLKKAFMPLQTAQAPLMKRAEAPLDLARARVVTAKAPLMKTPEPLPTAPTSEYDPIIERAAKRHRLHPQILKAVIACESAGDPNAVSSKGAKGLMQLADSTAQMLGVRDVWDPEENVEGGARYLRTLLDRFDHRLDWALAAYNAGPGAVERHQGIPPYDETVRYVKKVLDLIRPGQDVRHGS